MKKGYSRSSNFFYGAPPEIFRNSKELRNNTTEAEKELWKHLKSKQIKGYQY
jgi:very-short-patch-repair endonuclease